MRISTPPPPPKGPKSAKNSHTPPKRQILGQTGGPIAKKSNHKKAQKIPPTPRKCPVFHDLAQNRKLATAVMLREPAGEMDLENGFTDVPKMPNYTLYCAVSGLEVDARRFTAYTF